MAIFSATLAFTGTAISLDQALPTDQSPGGTQDFGFREILLSCDTANCFIGDSKVTTTKYGVEVFVATNATPPVYLGPFDSGPIKLSSLYVVGSGSGNLHIIGIPF